ncbi:TonB-dependent receptor [Aquirufa salirivi]|uniref:TonB-dependent receptor n=1 Tax=Aquirufa salirivi TaxID=3104729 RepID=A0ABW8RXP6_9BACT
MKKFLFILFLFSTVQLFAQKVKISGIVTSSESNERIPGASIRVKGSSTGVSTNAKGEFELAVSNVKIPFTITISAVGYGVVEVPISSENQSISIVLAFKSILLTEVVSSATRVNQNILESPVSIEKMSNKAIKENPSFTFYDGLVNLKGLEAVTSSITYKQINTRGFNTTGNSRFLQLVDGVDNQTPGLNFAVGNQFGASDLDVESAEVIPGAASALYGPVAFNGLLSIKTKDAFKYQGLSFSIKSGLNHVGEVFSDPKGLNDFAFRFAKSFNDKIAFKVNVSYLAGTDWYANNYTDVNASIPGANRGPNNPARDALNIYGDEVTKNIAGVGVVNRTGYEEKDLMNYGVYSFKLNGALQYKISKNLEAVYQYNFGQGTASYTGSSRFDLNNFTLQTHRLELRGSNFFIRGYSVQENSNDSYNTRSLGQFINRTWVQDLNGQVVSPANADAMWFTRYEAAFKGTVNSVSANDNSAARAFADRGRLAPGTMAFEAAKDASIHNYGLSGAGVFSASKFYHADGQYDLSKDIKFVDLLVGGSVRQYSMFTNGSLFDDAKNPISILEWGSFVQASKKLFNEKLKLAASLRYDKNENFQGNSTPRFSGVYSVTPLHNFRASYQTGFRNPTPVDQFIKLNVGPITILGGAPNNSAGMNVYENSYMANSVNAFGNAVGAAIGAGTSPPVAIAANKDLLVKANVAYIKPEQQKAFELGYKGVVNGKLLIDLNYYQSWYTDFILNTVVIQPAAPVLGSDGKPNIGAAYQVAARSVNAYQLYTNASDEVSAQGFSLGLTYLLDKGYVLGGNLTNSNFNLGSANVNNIAQFNTPEYSTNLNFGNANIGGSNYGFNVNLHWQSQFDWYGTFNGNRPGTIPAYSLVDVQINKKLPKQNVTIKLGASNLFNNHVSQSYGSPAIGGIYYISLVYDNPLK